MTLRCIHALQAAILCAVIALPFSYLILSITEITDNLVFSMIAAVGSACIMTPGIWYLAFPNTNCPPKRGIWVGPLIVFFVMWLMLVFISININETYLEGGSVFKIVLKAVTMSLLFTVFGSFYIGALLFPFAALIAV